MQHFKSVVTMVIVKAWNSYRIGRLSTVDLLVKIASFVKKEKVVLKAAGMG